MKRTVILFTLLCFNVFVSKSQEQKDSLLIPKNNCLPDDEEIEVFLKKSEMFGLYSYLRDGHHDPTSLLYPLNKETLIKWLPSDTGRALIEKLLPKGKDTVLFKHSRPFIKTSDSSWSVSYPWTHTPLKRKERKEAEKEVMVLLNGQELLALFHLFAFNDTYYRPRLFKILRENYCNYASLGEVKEWVRFYQSNYEPYGEYFLKL